MTKNVVISVIAGVALWAFFRLVVWSNANSGEAFFSIVFPIASAWILEMALTNRDRVAGRQ